MATPIRQLLRSQLLSSPLLYAPKRPLIKNLRSPYKKAPKFNRNSVRLSLFSKTPTNTFQRSDLRQAQFNTDLCEDITDSSVITIKVADYGKNLLSLNTPNKKELLESGTLLLNNLKILGQGSFGLVVQGICGDKEVAIKIIKSNKCKFSFYKEANALILNHRNVVKLFDVIHKAECNYGLIVMEYIQSKNLLVILEDASVDINDELIVKIASQICEGLKYCHQNDIIHLDIKPSNVLVAANYVCKICDFGNSVNVAHLKQVQNSWTNCGTVAYTAPELLLGKQPVFESDIYSFGILLWQIIHRQIPYANVKDAEVIVYKVVKLSYRPDSDGKNGRNKYSSIYRKCWSSNTINRPHFNEIINKLKNIYS